MIGLESQLLLFLLGGRLRLYIVYTQEDPGLRESSYELCYNHSCYLIGQGDMSGAQEKLRKAEGILDTGLDNQKKKK